MGHPLLPINYIEALERENKDVCLLLFAGCGGGKIYYQKIAISENT